MINTQLHNFKCFEKPLTSFADGKYVANEVSKESWVLIGRREMCANINIPFWVCFIYKLYIYICNIFCICWKIYTEQPCNKIFRENWNIEKNINECIHHVIDVMSRDYTDITWHLWRYIGNINSNSLKVYDNWLYSDARIHQLTNEN